jgi:hypothetical protein
MPLLLMCDWQKRCSHAVSITGSMARQVISASYFSADLRWL